MITPFIACTQENHSCPLHLPVEALGESEIFPLHPPLNGEAH